MKYKDYQFLFHFLFWPTERLFLSEAIYILGSLVSKIIVGRWFLCKHTICKDTEQDVVEEYIDRQALVRNYRSKLSLIFSNVSSVVELIWLASFLALKGPGIQAAPIELKQFSFAV